MYKRKSKTKTNKKKVQAAYLLFIIILYYLHYFYYYYFYIYIIFFGMYLNEKVTFTFYLLYTHKNTHTCREFDAYICTNMYVNI